MRLRPFNTVFLLVFATLMCSFSLNAQEGRPQAEIEGASKETPRIDPEPTTVSDSESRTTGKATTNIIAPKEARDSVQVKTVKPVKPTEKSAKEEEDPLSFNFLYYIIEKFKLSDIIE